MKKDLEAGSQPAAAPHPLRASHTAGPWVAQMGRTIVHIVGADGHGITGVSLSGFKGMTADERNEYRARALSDAALIESAPTMRRALDLIASQIRDHGDLSASSATLRVWAGIIDAALSKAGA